MRHLTFADLARVHEAGYRHHQYIDNTQGINVGHETYYDFEWYPSHIPGEDRVVRLTFSREECDPTWMVVVLDRDLNGDVYHEESFDAQHDLSAALTWAIRYPWTPSPERLVDLLRQTTGEVTCRDGVLTLPDGTQLHLPGETTE